MGVASLGRGHFIRLLQEEREKGFVNVWKVFQVEGRVMLVRAPEILTLPRL